LKKAEAEFLPKYYLGRKEYLTRKIEQLTLDIANLQKLQENLQPQMLSLSQQLSSLPRMEDCKTTTHYDSSTQKEEKKTTCEEALYVRSLRNQLNSQLGPLRDLYTRQGNLLILETGILVETRTELTKIPVGQ
jgi:hypothetical protein